MRDPLQYAIKSRRAHVVGNVLDDAKLPGQPGGHEGAAQLEKQEEISKGDLAPEVKEKKEFGASYDDPEGLDLQDAVHGNELENPEHNPLLRGQDVDQMGHEREGQDGDIESHLMQGHELDQPRSPKTLGARVRAALSSKKG